MNSLDEVDMATRGRAYLGSLAGRRVAVVGLAKSGVAAARLLRAAGADVVGADAKPVGALGRDAAGLAELGVRLLAGARDTAAALADRDLVVVSPGVPLDGDQLAAARARGVPIIGELELGWRATEADTIAITGTNGKTTTTALTGAVLAQQPRPVLVAGNIGTPLAAHALAFPADGLVVCEVSSFQLETTELFQPRVAVVLNLTPDHLDRHGTFGAYVDAKARIFANQTPTDCAVLNADDEATRALGSRVRAPVVWFSRRRELAHGVFVRDGRIAARLNGHVEDICPLSEIFLRGQHNVENVLAATACALWTGVSPAAIRTAVARFRGVAHRIEWVRDLKGVHYYNDSKGTNVASTLRALESFPERIVLIAGGKGKGQAWGPLAAAARGRVAHALLIGEDAEKIGAALAAAAIPVTFCRSLQDAVERARAELGWTPAYGGRDATLRPYNYFHPAWHPYYHGTDLHTLQSVTKSVTAVLVGMALARHAIPTLDVPILQYFDATEIDHLDDWKQRITLRHLLTMSAGLDWDELSVPYEDPANVCQHMEQSADWTRFTLNRPMAYAPGTVFAYNSGLSQLLSPILLRATGSPVDAYAAACLFAPLGITDFYWKRAPGDLPDTEGGLYLRRTDLAKIGYLYLVSAELLLY